MKCITYALNSHLRKQSDFSQSSQTKYMEFSECGSQFLPFVLGWTLGWSRCLNGLPRWLSCKESAHQEGDVGSIPGLGRSPGGWNGHATPVFLLGEVYGQRSLVGLQSMGLQRVKHDWARTHLLTLSKDLQPAASCLMSLVLSLGFPLLAMNVLSSPLNEISLISPVYPSTSTLFLLALAVHLPTGYYLTFAVHHSLNSLLSPHHLDQHWHFRYSKTFKSIRSHSTAPRRCLLAHRWWPHCKIYSHTPAHRHPT